MLRFFPMYFCAAILLLVLASLPVSATTTTYTFTATGDAWMTGDSHLDENHGSDIIIRIGHPPRIDRPLIKFSTSGILSAIGTSHVVSAYLKLYEESNYNNWNEGAYIDAHRINTNWDELGVTWDCYPSDTNLSNTNPDCDDQWLGGFYDDYVSDSLLIVNNQLGWQQFNVTNDILLIQNGYDNYGWLLKKRDETHSGRSDFTSIQGISSQRPILVVTVDDQTSCSPTSISAVTPGWIPTDGSLQTITISGTNLNSVTSVLKNSVALSFTLLDSNTITFTDSATVVETHEIQINTTCISEPIPIFEIQAVDAASQAEYPIHEPYGPNSPDSSCPAGDSTTLLKRDASGKFLCYGGAPIRLVGYSAFEEITWNKHYVPGTCTDCPSIPEYMAAVRYWSNATPTPHGVNLQRIFALGASGGLGTGAETMPFTFASGTKYNVSNNAPIDSTTYLPRLKTVLDSAVSNGQSVELTLFDGVALQLTYTTGNPWYPGNGNNNMYDTCAVSLGGLKTASPFPEFYNICTTGNTNSSACSASSLNCLGLMEKNYVRKLVSWVYNHHYKNVFFEIANEPKTNNLGVDPVRYEKWHATVAQWIKSGHGFLVSANTDPQSYNSLLACCSGVTSDSSVCGLATCVEGGSDPNTKCSGTQCSDQNINGSFLLPGIDIVTFHGAWHDDGNGNVVTCSLATEAARRFKKPVIIDDDGVFPARNTNCAGTGSDDVKTWAKNVKSCLGIGRVHFNHLDEMKHMPNGTPICALNPAESPNKYLDCNALDILADANPSQLCGKGYSCTCPPAGTFLRYCFSTANGTCTTGADIECDNNVQSCNH